MISCNCSFRSMPRSIRSHLKGHHCPICFEGTRVDFVLSYDILHRVPVADEWRLWALIGLRRVLEGLVILKAGRLGHCKDAA